MRFFKVVAINLLVTLALLEIGLFAASRLGLLSMDLPSYSLANVQPFWRDSNRDFGVWHAANSQYRHLKSCFDVTYRSNSHGMRDKERALQSEKPRVVVLGDSFMEGFGVEQHHRLSDVLEKQTAIAHLNFGTSGHFGLTQSWMLYKSLAARFDHDAVILSILPDNDFRDDDFDKAATVYKNRYRPYLIGNYPDYEIRYTEPNAVRTMLRTYSKYAERAIDEFSYTAKAHAYLKGYLRAIGRNDASKFETGGVASRYFEFTSAEFDRMRYAIEQIVALAAPRPVLVMSIPRRSDYDRAMASSEPAPLSQRLRALSKTAGFTYVDLLERTSGRPGLDKLFLPCDSHWSAAGNEMAANELMSWSYYKAGPSGNTPDPDADPVDPPATSSFGPASN